MVLFEVNRSDSEDEASAYEIEASRKWTLPGVRCDACNLTWAATAVVYPSQNLSLLGTEASYSDPEPVSVERLEDLRRPIQAILPPGAPLPPGTEFGPLEGTILGTFGDFVWLDAWTPLVSTSVWERLLQNGIEGVSAVRTHLVDANDSAVELLELDLRLQGELVTAGCESIDPPRCERCGHIAIRAPDRILLRQSSIQPGIDLFRSVDLTTYIFATPSFVAVVREFELTGISFRETRVLSC